MHVFGLHEHPVCKIFTFKYAKQYFKDMGKVSFESKETAVWKPAQLIKHLEPRVTNDSWIKFTSEMDFFPEDYRSDQKINMSVFLIKHTLQTIV